MPGPAFRRGDAVALHPVEEEDIEFLQRHRNDPDIRSGLTTAFPETRHEAEERFERHSESDDGVGLLIVPEGRGEPVGQVVGFDIDATHGTAELAAWVAPPEQGNGYAAAGTRLLVDYLFGERRLAKLVARALVTNAPSRAVLERVGFTLEGIQRQEKYVNGEHVDVARYSLLAEEWESDATGPSDAAGSGGER